MAKNRISAPVDLDAVAPEPEPIAAPRPTKARVLVDVTVNGELHRSGALLEADAEVIKELGDRVDTHPDAVAYAEKLNG